MKIGIIGIGKMGEAILRSLVKSFSAEDIFIHDTHTEKAEKLSQELEVKNCALNDAFQDSDTLILAIKPQDFDTLNIQAENRD